MGDRTDDIRRKLLFEPER